MTTKRLLIETLATFGRVGKNCLNETTVSIPLPSNVRSATRFADTVANRIEQRLEEQEIPYYSNGGMIELDDGSPRVELDFVSKFRR